jgi:hypothetical protein
MLLNCPANFHELTWIQASERIASSDRWMPGHCQREKRPSARVPRHQVTQVRLQGLADKRVYVCSCHGRADESLEVRRLLRRQSIDG